MSCRNISVSQGTWNDLEEMKYLLCAIECWYVYPRYYLLDKGLKLYAVIKEIIFLLLKAELCKIA